MKLEDGRGDEFVGDKYGIQIKGDNLQKCVLAIIKASNYVNVPLSSHHGTTFNLVYMKDIRFDLLDRKGYMLFVFKRKYWKTELISNKERFWTKDIECYFTKKEKQALIKMFRVLGYKIKDKWNDKNQGNSISILINKKAKFDTNYETSLDKFIKTCNDFGEMEE